MYLEEIGKPNTSYQSTLTRKKQAPFPQIRKITLFYILGNVCLQYIILDQAWENLDSRTVEEGKDLVHFAESCRSYFGHYPQGRPVRNQTWIILSNLKFQPLIFCPLLSWKPTSDFSCIRLPVWNIREMVRSFKHLSESPILSSHHDCHL